MAKAIQISRQSTVWIPHLQSYKLVVEAINPQDMPGEVFIKQRLRNFAQDSFDDNFVGVCTPVQLEDLPVNAPDAGSSFYRVSKIELVGRLPEAIDKIFDSLIYEVQKLVDDLNSLDYLNEAKIYDISAGNTEVIPGPVPEPLVSNKVRIGSNGYLEALVVNDWRPAAVTIYVNNFGSLPITGNVGLLYISRDTNIIYRWDTVTNSYLAVSGSSGAVSSVAGRTGNIVLTKNDVELGNVDNTSDLDKPISTATQTALDNKADTGHTHEISDIANLQNTLDDKANSTDIYNAAVEWTPNHTLADGTRYLAGDLVYSGGNIYKANFDNESMPVSNNTYWQNLGPGYRLNIDGRDIPNIPPPDLSGITFDANAIVSGTIDVARLPITSFKFTSELEDQHQLISYARWLNGAVGGFNHLSGAMPKWNFMVGSSYNYVQLEIAYAEVNGVSLPYSMRDASIFGSSPIVDNNNIYFVDNGYGLYSGNYTDFINSVFDQYGLQTRMYAGDDHKWHATYHQTDRFLFIFRETGFFDDGNGVNILTPWYFGLKSTGMIMADFIASSPHEQNWTKWLPI